jgi:homoserine O-acetyltransferase
MVVAHKLLADHLGIRQIQLLIGGSQGGQQCLEWAILEPGRIRQMALLATNARHSAWGIAYNEAQRMAIEADPEWGIPGPDRAQQGLAAARAIAMLSYRSYETYVQAQTDPGNNLPQRPLAASYQRYQGDKLVKRFNAYAYWYLSQAMDNHNVGRGRPSIEAALSQVQANTLVIGISSDGLFPVREQRFIAEHIPGATFVEIASIYGHDGFLVETLRIGHLLETWMEDTE